MMHMRPKLGTFDGEADDQPLDRTGCLAIHDSETPCHLQHGSRFEAYHQYLVEHPEVVLAHYQRHCPNASGMRFCTESGVGC